MRQHPDDELDSEAQQTFRTEILSESHLIFSLAMSCEALGFEFPAPTNRAEELALQMSKDCVRAGTGLNNALPLHTL